MSPAPGPPDFLQHLRPFRCFSGLRANILGDRESVQVSQRVPVVEHAELPVSICAERSQLRHAGFDGLHHRHSDIGLHPKLLQRCSPTQRKKSGFGFLFIQFILFLNVCVIFSIPNTSFLFNGRIEISKLPLPHRVTHKPEAGKLGLILECEWGGRDALMAFIRAQA